MRLDEENSKIERILDIYTRLNDGQIVNKQEIARRYNVHPRSVQRDMEDIRQYLDNQTAKKGLMYSLVYDRQRKGYRLEYLDAGQMMFSNEEVLAVCKILLDSRAFPKKTMMRILDKMMGSCVPAMNRKLVGDLMANERFHYIPPHHNKDVLDKLWTLGQAIADHKVIEVKYHRLKGDALKNRRLEPLAIMFSEMYFYLVAFIEDIDKEEFENSNDPFPTIYRIDRIQQLKTTEEHFAIPYRNRFEEGEFRKRIQFMQGGKLRRIRFEYSGISIESVLDRLPTAQIIQEKDGVYTVQAEVFGDGVDRWIRSQGESVKVIYSRE